MGKIEEILGSALKPKEKQAQLVEAVLSGKITGREFIDYFKAASDIDKGTCADAMKHVSAEKPEIFLPYVDLLIGYINYDAPRVKWGVPETIGNMAKRYPREVEKAIPYLLKNTVENNENTTVIRWCAAYALSEIAIASRDRELASKIEGIAKKETNSGVRNVYLKALRRIEREGHEVKNNRQEKI